MPDQPSPSPDPDSDRERGITEAIADATRPTALVGQLPAGFDDTATLERPGSSGRGRLDLVGRAPGAPDAIVRSKTETVHLHRGEVWGGDFQLGPLIGRGGMGAVYAGRQLSLDRPVAIKALRGHLSDDPELVARFEQEAKWLARISSPHVIQVHAFGRHENHHFLVMELIEGEDVGRKLKAGWRPGHLETVDLIAQATRGLITAGEHGIVHRDIKPGNIMLTTRGVLKLTDFGLARLVHGVGTLSSTGVILGTDAYMSPEQCQGRAVDQRSDLYSLGVVFYELLTGRRPFTGETHMELFCQHIEREPDAPRSIDPTIPEAVERVVLTCLAKEPRARYQTAADLLADLERVRAHQWPNARPPLRRSAVLRTAGVVALALLLAAGAAWTLWPRAAPSADAPRTPEPPPVVPVAPSPVASSQPAPDAPPQQDLAGSAAEPVAERAAAAEALQRRHAELVASAATPAPAAERRRAWARLEHDLAAFPGYEQLRDDARQRCNALPDTIAPAPKWAASYETDAYGSRALLDSPRYRQYFRWIPAAPSTDPSSGTAASAGPAAGFWMAETETTERQWCEVRDLPRMDSDLPKAANWEQATQFCSSLRGLLKPGDVAVALPTEAEWAWACAAGRPLHAAEIGPVAWTFQTSSQRRREVGKLAPNPWGLRDTYGNVAEWCADGGDGATAIARGGHFDLRTEHCLVEARHGPLRRDTVAVDTFGFRILIRE